MLLVGDVAGLSQIENTCGMYAAYFVGWESWSKYQYET
jgi:hypothetical protein